MTLSGDLLSKVEDYFYSEDLRIVILRLTFLKKPLCPLAIPLSKTKTV